MTHKNILTHLLGLTLFLTLASCSEQSEQTDKISNVGPAAMQAGRALLSDNCSGCHVESADGTFSRISQIRKSPEGWDMNIARMTVFHGLHIEPEDRRALVKFLSDTQGLAPTETAAHRDVLERKHNVIEQGVDPDLAAMCARCHTYARVALQRRDKAEWQNLVHMHLGQWASIEYQMLSRERDWRADALGPVAEKLGEMYPLQTEAWSAWQQTEWQNMAGDWRIIGHIPGVGDVDGIMTATAGEGDTYAVTYNFIWPDGSLVAGTGKSIVHGGYEWRGAATLNDQKYRQIWAASEDGNQMRGRMFHKDHPEDGIAITALRKTSDRATIMNVSPFALKAGEATEIVISGMGLSGDVKIPGVDVKVVAASSDRIVVVATAGADVSGAAPLSVGTQKSAQDVVLYTQVDYLKVTPDYGISRVGGGGGPIPKVMAQFEATGYTVGADGIRDTADDLMLGLVPVTWTVDNYNETAAEMQDKKYAGTITATGTFIPAVAGPNPERKYGTNNAGDLKIIATYGAGATALTAEAHLIATVQRWNTPPIQ